MGQTYTLHELFIAPKRWKSISAFDIATKYTEEALKSKETFLNFLQHMYAYNPWYIKAIVFGAPNSVYSIKELFLKEQGFLPPEPKYGYGSQTLFQILKDIENSYDNQTINKAEYRKRLLYKAAETLTQDDYKVFSMVIKNEFPDGIYKYIEELYKERNLPESISNQFMFSLNTDALYSVPDNVFNNNTNSEYVYIPKNELSFYLLYKNTIVKLNSKFEKTIVDIDKNNVLHNKLVKKSSMIVLPEIVICDNDNIIGIITIKGIFLYVQPYQISEHVFSTKICEGMELAFIIDRASLGTRGLPKVIGTIGYAVNTLEKCTKQAASFTVSVLPYCGYSASIITCQEKDSENVFHVFALTEQANKLAKNLKNFKLASLQGRYFYMR